MGIAYSKQSRVNAARRNLDLFACGFVEALGKGRTEFEGPMDYLMANALFCFAHLVYSGKSPAEAFAMITWPQPPTEGRDA